MKQNKKTIKKLKSLNKDQLIYLVTKLQEDLEQKEAELKQYRSKLEEKIDEHLKEYEQNKLNRSKEFGKRSEKIDVIVNDVEANLEKEPKPRGKYKSRLETVLKELKGVVKEKVVIDYDFEANGVDRNQVKEFGSDVTIKIEVMDIPIKIVEIERKKYKDKNKIYQTISKDVFPHSLATPSFVANLLMYRYLLQVPLYRYSMYLQNKNLPISESNLSNYIKKAGEILKPIYNKIKETIKENKVIHIDETTINVLDVTEKSKCYIFAYCGSLFEQNQVRIYEFSIDRKTEKTKELLKGYNGYVSCDGYSGYDSLGVEVQRCFTHIRRKFVECLKVLPKGEVKKSPSYKIVGLINEMYKKEKEYKEKKYTVEQIEKERNGKEYNKILKELDDEIEKVEGTKNELLQKAVKYYKNIKEKGELYTFQKSGYLEIDNNRAERAIKPFTIGRKNFLFCKTEIGAEITSEMYTIVETAKENNVEPEKYIKYVLENIKEKEIEKLLPWDEEIQEKFSFVKDKK